MYCTGTTAIDRRAAVTTPGEGRLESCIGRSEEHATGRNSARCRLYTARISRPRMRCTPWRAPASIGRDFRSSGRITALSRPEHILKTECSRRSEELAGLFRWLELAGLVDGSPRPPDCEVRASLARTVADGLPPYRVYVSPTRWRSRRPVIWRETAVRLLGRILTMRTRGKHNQDSHCVERIALTQTLSSRLNARWNVSCVSQSCNSFPREGVVGVFCNDLSSEECVCPRRTRDAVLPRAPPGKAAVEMEDS